MTDDPSAKAMREMDRIYREVSGLQESRHYKIFYSHIHPFPLLVLGYNPGGESDGTDMRASESFYENYEHDYVRFRQQHNYSLAGPMCTLLEYALDTTASGVLRQVPASNVIFRRSSQISTLEMKDADAAAEAAPILGTILKIVSPQCILLVSTVAFELFASHHCNQHTMIAEKAPEITTPNGRSRASLFRYVRAHVPALNRTLPLVVVGHPSKYATRAEWPAVLSAVRTAMHECGVSHIAGWEGLATLPSIPNH